MKNYRILSKKTIKRFVLAGLVPVLSVCSIIFSSVFAVKVKADATSVTLGNDSYGTWSTSINISIGNISNVPLTVAMPTNSYLVPFDMDMQGGIGTDLSIYGVTIPIYLTDGTYFYQGEGSYSSGIRLHFPNNMSLRRVNGTVSIAFRFAPQLQFYQSYDKAFKIPSSKIIDQSYRYEVSLGDFSYDGCFASLVRSSSSGYYFLNLTFDDFLIPSNMNSTYPSLSLFIPINLGVKFQLSVAAGTYTIVQPSGVITGNVVPMTECEVLTAPVLGSSDSQASLSGPSFINSNDYYTILHALADSQFLTDQASDVALLKDLLASWVGSSDPASIPVDFGTFALVIYQYLGSIQSSLLSAEDLNSINNSLTSLISAQNTTNSNLSSLISMLDQYALNSQQADRLIGTYLQDIDTDLASEHDIYLSSLLSFRSSLTSILNGYSGYSSVTTPATVYSGWLQAFYVSLGSFALVISAVLFGGILLRILGKVH